MEGNVSGSVYRVLMRIGHIEVAYVRKCTGMGRGRVDERRIERADAQTERLAGEMDGARDRLCSTAAASPGYRAYIIDRACSGFGGGMPR